jgi:nitrate reductase gamma subunit
MHIDTPIFSLYAPTVLMNFVPAFQKALRIKPCLQEQLMYDLVRGPMVWISLILFFLGTVFQVFRFLALSRKVSPPTDILLLHPEKAPPRKLSLKWMADRFQQLRNTVLAVHPVTMTVSTIFHLGLVFVPLFLLGHNELIELTFGVSLPSVAESTSDALTCGVLACCAFFLFRRIFLRQVRSITSFNDYLVLALATVPFLSGFLAFHQIGPYRTVMIVHMLSGELMLIAIPFSKLTHMIFFFFNRFIVVNEHTLGRGSRAW